MPHTLSKSERLCGERKISNLFDNGESGFVYPFRYVYMANEAVEGNRTVEGETVEGGVAILVSVSKRYHKRANKRNLIKRRTREAYRLNNDTLKFAPQLHGKQLNIALIYSSKEVIEYKIVENAVKKIIAAVSERL